MFVMFTTIEYNFFDLRVYMFPYLCFWLRTIFAKGCHEYIYAINGNRMCTQLEL